MKWYWTLCGVLAAVAIVGIVRGPGQSAAFALAAPSALLQAFYVPSVSVGRDGQQSDAQAVPPGATPIDGGGFFLRCKGYTPPAGGRTDGQAVTWDPQIGVLSFQKPPNPPALGPISEPPCDPTDFSVKLTIPISPTISTTTVQWTAPEGTILQYEYVWCSNPVEAVRCNLDTSPAAQLHPFGPFPIGARETKTLVLTEKPAGYVCVWVTHRYGSSGPPATFPLNRAGDSSNCVFRPEP